MTVCIENADGSAEAFKNEPWVGFLDRKGQFGEPPRVSEHKRWRSFDWWRSQPIPCRTIRIVYFRKDLAHKAKHLGQPIVVVSVRRDRQLTSKDVRRTLKLLAGWAKCRYGRREYGRVLIQAYGEGLADSSPA